MLNIKKFLVMMTIILIIGPIKVHAYGGLWDHIFNYSDYEHCRTTVLAKIDHMPKGNVNGSTREQNQYWARNDAWDSLFWACRENLDYGY